MQNARPINRESMRSKRRWEILRRKNILTTARFSHFQKTTEVCPVFLMPKWFVFFACPDAVYNKIMDRLGSELADYQLKNNSLTFVPIRLCEPAGDGAPRALKALKPKTTTTTIQQVQIAFSSPTNLPEAGSYEKAIRAALGGG